MKKPRYYIIPDDTSKDANHVLAIKETYPDIIVLTRTEAKKIIEDNDQKEKQTAKKNI